MDYSPFVLCQPRTNTQSSSSVSNKRKMSDTRKWGPADPVVLGYDQAYRALLLCLQKVQHTLPCVGGGNTLMCVCVCVCVHGGIPIIPPPLHETNLCIHHHFPMYRYVMQTVMSIQLIHHILENTLQQINTNSLYTYHTVQEVYA